MNSLENTKTLQDEVRDFLKSQGISQKRFSRGINVSQGMLNHWLHHRTSLNHDTIENIQKVITRRIW